MSEPKKLNDKWNRLNVLIEPRQYNTLNTLKVKEYISLGEAVRIMLDIAICVMLDEPEKAKDTAKTLHSINPDILRKLNR